MSRRSAERRCARPEMSESGVQTCLKYAGPVPRIQSKAVAATLYTIRWRTGSQWTTSRRSDVLKFRGTDNKPGGCVQDHHSVADEWAEWLLLVRRILTTRSHPKFCPAFFSPACFFVVIIYSSGITWSWSNVLGEEITQPVRWPLFCHRRANAVEQCAWTASATGHHLQTIQSDRWKRLCLVSWAAAPCVWTLRELTRNLLTYLLTYLHIIHIFVISPYEHTYTKYDKLQ